MRTIHRMVLAAMLILSGLVLAPVANAKAGDVIRTGACSGSSDWKLKLGPENGQIQVEFEVDSNVAGQTWSVRIAKNGVRIFAGRRVTQAPSGSFTVRLRTANGPGVDRFRASATNRANGETCVGIASIA
jgi:hypothetical protein